MLSSAFVKDSDSVFVDLLTYADLEMLKARKIGGSSSSSAASTSSKAQLKRYVILTYQSEFDRVHYPLPLAFEDKPNAEAMKRTIRRLRSQANSTSSASTHRDANGTKIVSQLRQENQGVLSYIRHNHVIHFAQLDYLYFSCRATTPCATDGE